ncbi:MAG: hypothetical protein IKW81_14145 [Pseudobutyrivibrio sp.]|nr:hypothetical protein [Pseudobutyrivibrio sp.]
MGKSKKKKIKIEKVASYITVGAALVALFTFYFKFIEYRIDTAFLRQWNITNTFDFADSPLKLIDVGTSVVVTVIVTPLFSVYLDFFNYVTFCLAIYFISSKEIQKDEAYITVLRASLDLEYDSETEQKLDEVQGKIDQYKILLEDCRGGFPLIVKCLVGLIICICFFLWISMSLTIKVITRLQALGFAFLLLLVIPIIIEVFGLVVALSKNNLGLSEKEFLKDYILNKEPNHPERLLEKEYYVNKGISYYARLVIIPMLVWYIYAPFSGYISAKSISQLGVVQMDNSYYAIIYTQNNRAITERCFLEDNTIKEIDSNKLLLVDLEGYEINNCDLDKNYVLK